MKKDELESMGTWHYWTRETNEKWGSDIKRGHFVLPHIPPRPLLCGFFIFLPSGKENHKSPIRPWSWYISPSAFQRKTGKSVTKWQRWEWALSMKFIGFKEMGIDFFPSFLLLSFMDVQHFSLPFPDSFLIFFFFTRQVLVSCYKSNEELLKCTTGTNPCKDQYQTF